MEHRLPIKPEFHPFQQPLRRMSKEVELKVKEEIEKLLKAKFIKPTRYVQWLANIVLMMEKNGKLRVCVDFRDLNVVTPKDMYIMPIADMLIDSTENNELLSFMDGFSGCNQIIIVVDDISKTVVIWLSAQLLYSLYRPPKFFNNLSRWWWRLRLLTRRYCYYLLNLCHLLCRKQS